ncbi:MAG: hypothetical protein WB610_10955 [Rhodomicrobium sp.]
MAGISAIEGTNSPLQIPKATALGKNIGATGALDVKTTFGQAPKADFNEKGFRNNALCTSLGLAPGALPSLRPSGVFSS